MFIGPCIIEIVDEWKTNLKSLATLFHLLCAQHVSDINISILRSLRLCWWITTSVVLFSVRCVLELLLRLIFGGVRFAGWSTTCWAHNKWNKTASDIKLVFHSSTMYIDLHVMYSSWIFWTNFWKKKSIHIEFNPYPANVENMVSFQ